MKKIILLTILLSSLGLWSCEKDGATKLPGTTWKTFDVYDSNTEEYILLKFKSTTFEMWYKDIGDPIYMDGEGIYTSTDNTVTLILGSETEIGVINKNKMTFSDDGDITTFTKQK